MTSIPHEDPAIKSLKSFEAFFLQYSFFWLHSKQEIYTYIEDISQQQQQKVVVNE
jgi:hypothetical protein